MSPAGWAWTTLAAIITLTLTTILTLHHIGHHLATEDQPPTLPRDKGPHRFVDGGHCDRCYHALTDVARDLGQPDPWAEEWERRYAE